MPQQKNSLLRVLVPVGLFAVAVGVSWSVYKNTRSGTSQTPTPAAAASPTAPASPAPSGPSQPAPVNQPAQPSAQAPAQAAATPTSPTLSGLRALSMEGDPAAANFAPIGSLDPKGALETELRFSTLGAGISSISLAKHFDTIKKDSHTVVQSQQTYAPDPAGPTQVIVPMAADSVEISGAVVSLLGSFDDPGLGKRVGTPIWRQTAPGSFEAFVVDGAGAKVARIGRTYSLTPGSFDIQIRQTIENLTASPITARWSQFGPTDLAQDAVAYGGDKRRVRFGYLLEPSKQTATDATVSFRDYIWGRADKPVMGPTDARGFYETVKAIWPNEASIKNQFRPVWAGLTNRYFAAAMHPLVPPGAGPEAKANRLLATVDRVLLQRVTMTGSERKYEPVLILRSRSEPVAVEPGKSADFSTGLYAGPLDRAGIFKDQPAADAGLASLVVYSWGGPCAICTFAWVTSALLGLMRFLHSYLVFDWALAIIVLVLCVRTLLHPITKFQQIRMARFSKGMQAMAPKQKKIQEKFANDPQKLREEMARLWREEGVNPLSGASGCLPGFLQTPIWIGLSATLYYAFDLRHQPAFFGAFQKLSGGKWWFLGDLAEPDRFIYFGKTIFTLPILGPISSINILPIILGVVFFIQQKYLTPPSTTTLTPEQEQQQKIMKWMMVFMFPTMMYAAPSGLALYFIVNSTLAILESRYIRSHIDKYDLTKVEKKPGGGGGFMARLQRIAEERQRAAMQARGMQPPRKRV